MELRTMKILKLFFCCWISLLIGFIKGEKCSSSDNESILQPGYEYTYKFHSQAFAEAVGTTDERNKIEIFCEVIISHSHDCFYILKLEDCKLNALGGSPGHEKAFKDSHPLSDLSKYSVLFSLIKGEIDEVYTHEEDPIHLVNIKRGALSAFVFKLSYVKHAAHEMHTDVHGTCPISAIPSHGNRGSARISKDMLQCFFPSRTDYEFSPFSMFWNMSFIQYLINSTTDCDYEIHEDEKRIDKVFCKERHAIMLESSSRTAVAVQTNIYYRLDYVESHQQTNKAAYPLPSRKTDIRYEYNRTPDPVSGVDNFLQKAKKMFSDLVLDSVDEIRLFTIPQFTDFIAWIRSSDDLIPLVNIIKSCSFLPEGVECTNNIKELSMSYLRDSLVQCNSLPCIKAISRLAENGDLSPAYMNFIFYSWSNMHYAKPAILKHITNICSATDSSLCWISLGKIARRMHEKYPKLVENEIRYFKEVAVHFRTNVEIFCKDTSSEASKPTSKEYGTCLTYLKAIANMGSLYIILLPNGDKQLIDYGRNVDMPLNIRIAALEVLGKVTAYNNKASLHEIYESLLPIFLSTSVSTSLRILAFDQLLLTDQEGFENHIITILKRNENQQLKTYIAQKLNLLLNDADFKKDKQEFVTSFSKLLKENEISLDILAHQPEVESKSSFSGMFAYLPYLPDHLKDFILKTVLSSVYEVNGVFPQYYHSDIALKAFNNLVRIFEAGGYFEGLEDIAITLQKTFEGINLKNVSFGEVIQGVKLAIENLYRENEKPQVEYSFDGRVTENIKKLYDLYLQFHPKAMPSFNMYFSLFGSTLGFLTTGDMAGMSTKLEKIQSFLSNLRDGVTYNTTRIIRIIEAYHQVPTMMGLPLNWTTNATLAYSVRSGLKLKLNENYEVDSEGFFNPSAALTFLNRMVVDFPTVTQIGVQANSSGYTSTQSKVKLIYTEKEKLLRFEKPSKSQKILELFRTNQLIRGDQYIDISDWDIERKISSWCTNNDMNSLLGLEVCLDKSYPIVTHRLKPWALMSGWCKWRFVINPFDKKLKSYDLELIKIPQGKSKELILRFSTPGSENSREVYVTANMNETNGELKFELKPTASSNFLISFIRDIITDNGKMIGYKSAAILKLDKDQQYQLTYKQQDKMEEREDFEDGNKSPKPQKVFLITDERLISLETPYNRYSWNIQHYKKGENEQKDILLSFENLDPKENTLTGILPDIYWENESKAYVQFRINWKEPNRNSNSISRQTVCFVHFPKSNIELVANSLEMSGREQININLTRSAKPSGKLLGFLNFTYDLWTSQGADSGSKEIRLYNITVPCKSWALKLESISENYSKQYFEVLFTRALMSPKEKEISDYIGWWNDDVSEDYSLEERRVMLKADIDIHEISGEDLVERYSTLTKEDVVSLNNQLITANIALYYPLRDQEESVTFDGYFVLSGARGIFRFQKNFVMGSSYNDLTLTSHSVFREESSEATLSHSSFFTNTITQKKAYNIIEYKRSYKEKCVEKEFKHNIKSEVFDLSTNISYKCNSNAENTHTLLLNITTQSSYWNLLNTRLEQIVEDVNSDYSYEEMNFRHPLATINVTAEWLKGDHKKKVIFTCLSNDCTNAELFFETLLTGKKTLALDILKENDKRHYSYERRISADSKNLNLNIKYSDSKTMLSEALDFSGQIINARYHIWRGKIDLPVLDKIRTRFTTAYAAASKYLSDITKDPEHPINEILKPTLKDTVYNFWKNIKTKSKEFISLPWTTFKELLHALHPFYWDLQATLTNILHSVKEKSKSAYNEIKERSIIIWAINYFNVPDAFYGSIMNVRASIKSLLKIFLQDDEHLEFEFKTGKLLLLESFRQLPSITLDPTEFYPFFKKSVQEIKPHHEQGFGTKIAMIFGPNHVYTFDGYVYDVPKYSSDCIFLLTHDLRISSFTVLSSKEAIHVLFPEISLSINAENEVFVNGSHIPSPLPIQANTVKVSLKKENIIKISSPSLTVICSNTDFLCVLELSIWHRGGTFGLLGNGDGIKSNDMILPNGKLASGLLEFINSFELSDKPECKELILPSKPSTSEEEKAECNQRFLQLCPQTKELRESFLDTCVTDLQDGYDICYATAGLSALCYYKNIPSTSDCKSKERDGEKIKHKLEVVLIVQEHHSLTSPEKKNSPNKGIERIITALDEKFKANGYSSVLFSLVGYGGEGVHDEPSLHSAGRSPWVPLQTMVNSVLKTLEFKGTDETDNLEALKYAAEVLGYDTFDSKIFIMLTESDKQSKNKATVDLIRRHLEKNGITLYTISSYRSLEKGKKVFGLRADGLIFPSPKKGESYLEYPKADLAKLTSATRGSIFLNKFVIANSPASFFSEFADEVWAKVRKEVQSCRDCKTVRSGWWSYIQECSVVHC